MGIFIDKVSVYCDTDNCDSKRELGVTEGAELGWLDEVTNSLDSSIFDGAWEIVPQENNVHFVRCPACSERFWDSHFMLEA